MKHSTRKIPHTNHQGLLSKTIVDTLNTPNRNGKLIQFKAKSDQNLQKKLILTLDGNVIREYPVTDHDLHIGRRHGNDIQINDQALSSRHALIFCDAKQMYIEDLESLNGTLVNGCQVKQTALKHGDIIQIGQHQLTYLCMQDSPFKPGCFIKAEHKEAAPVNTAYSPKKDGKKGTSLGGLQVIRKNCEQPEFVMELRKTHNTIGFRGKRMALITRGTHGYTIAAITGTQSRRSLDTPLLNGKKMQNYQNPLQPGDLISLAGYDIKFYLLN